ncbi:hypothetical protein S101258_01281 [Lactiplantibacillus plantarum subsp. plantarum]|uniref:Uncharacterized protein n=1 Tax=Lactiplantibacillus plantarum subsp. plantarum TaxID=337330 RepID=A0A2S3U7J2_LACPN|nr:hypothetical protein S101258_01281 [Lactiplantibacillus plantarum subsp. plantarum]
MEKDAIFHIEVFENSAGQLVLCEIAFRAGGGRIVPLIEHNSHINLYKELLVHQIERDELSDLREGQMHNDKYLGFCADGATPRNSSGGAQASSVRVCR